MKRSFTLRSVIALSMLGLFLSCHKRGEFEVPCKLMRISHVDRSPSPSPYDSYAGNVTWNAWGDPAKITWDLIATGRPNYVFTYDKKRRLTRFDGLYNHPTYDFVTNYIYEGDRITGDSTWYFGSDVNNYRNTAYVSEVKKYTYDGKGRITRVESTNSFGSSFVSTYEYDASGNRVRNDGAVYDNKKSYLRTNFWLMFITRDFSMNNPKTADAYNKKGLPLTYNTTVLTFMNSLVNEFDYSCDHKNH